MVYLYFPLICPGCIYILYKYLVSANFTEAPEQIHKILLKIVKPIFCLLIIWLIPLVMLSEFIILAESKPFLRSLTAFFQQIHLISYILGPNPRIAS